MSAPVYWSGKIGPADDFKRTLFFEFIDGRTRMGPWAIMSPRSFAQYGVGLGTGRGQRYKRQDDGRWLKVEG